MEVEFDISKPQQHAARAQPISTQKAPLAYIGGLKNAPLEGGTSGSVGF
jgi:hypothetical protein